MSQRKLTVDERIENGIGKWFNQFYEKQCRVWCFYSPFYISSALLIGYCKNDILVRTACLRPVVEYFASPTLTFVQLEQCASYRGSRRILSRRQHAPNKQCALNNDVRLITRFYGTLIRASVSEPHTSLFNCDFSLSGVRHSVYPWRCNLMQ